MWRSFVALLYALGLSIFWHTTPSQADTAQDCVADIPCPLGARSYHVLPPENWDGATPLPVLLHFHGWGRQGTLIVKHSRIAGATRPRGHFIPRGWFARQLDALLVPLR